MFFLFLFLFFLFFLFLSLFLFFLFLFLFLFFLFFFCGKLYNYLVCHFYFLKKWIAFVTYFWVIVWLYEFSFICSYNFTRNELIPKNDKNNKKCEITQKHIDILYDVVWLVGNITFYEFCCFLDYSLQRYLAKNIFFSFQRLSNV